MITVKQYKKKTSSTRYQAEIAIQYIKFGHWMKNKTRCPICGGKLEYEPAEYEDYGYVGSEECVYCEECEFTTDVKDGYVYISPYCCFDEVLFDCCGNGPLMSKSEQRGLLKHQTREFKKEMDKNNYPYNHYIYR